MPGTLYLLPNTLGPGGALSAVIPDPVLHRIASLDYFVAENAKSARAHLKAVGAVHPLTHPIQDIRIEELDVNTDAATLPRLLEPLLDGKDAGLLSEAGVPAVADPGANLVRLAHRRGVPVKPLVGPSSLLLAVMASGLNGQSFAFHGYLPTDPARRTERIRVLEKRSKAERQTQLFIETPYRNAAMLDALATACQPTTLLCVATDLTLASESVRTQTAAAWKSAIAAGKGPDFHKKPTVFLLLAD